MSKHWKYFKYVCKHKWFVFVAGLKTKAPLWRLIIHDYSKFSRAEWTPYVESFYSGRPREETKEVFQRGWLHHLHNNPHHWMHWILTHESPGSTAEGTMPYTAFDMPEKLVREMVADWMGAGRAITGHWDIQEWWDKSKSNMKLTYNTRELVIKVLKEVGVDG